MCKVDYVNNNLAECFNSWIKKIKQLPVVDLWDTLRQMIMEKLETRKEVAKGLPQVKLLPSVKKELNLRSKGLPYNISKADPTIAEVSGADSRSGTWMQLLIWTKGRAHVGNGKSLVNPAHMLLLLYSH